MISLDVEFVRYNYIAEKAEDFLLKNDIDSIPVPIDLIAEERYDINIIPFPNLQRDFETEGFITSDYSCIYVDEYTYNNVHVRYRFTVAHELGHLIMHDGYFSEVSFSNITEWKEFQKNLNCKDHDKLEFQGYSFAGLVLVPRHNLKEEFHNNLFKLDNFIREAKQKGIERATYLDYAVDKMASILAPRFEVSTEVVIKRINYDSLYNLIP